MYLLLNLMTFVGFGLVPAVLFFVLAGRWDVWNAWAAVGIFVGCLTFQTLAASRTSPDLLKERMKSGTPGRVRWTTARVYLVVTLLQWIIAGLDQRFHWSDRIPPAGVAAGLVLFALSWGLASWAALVNPFFSPEVRIQADRGQRVINTGPYAVVRHPGYATILLCVVVSGIALNSLLSLIPALLYLAVTVRVTAFEDRMLHDELTGYANYAANVRYRLVPGIW